MTKEEIIDDILAIPVETRTIEFKRLGSRNEGVDRTLESIVAMANTDGGIMIFGVEDPQRSLAKGRNRIFGIEENADLFDEIGRAVKKISPPIPTIWNPEFISVKDKNIKIALVAVPKVGDGFRSIEGHVYVRQERGNKRLSPQEIVHFAYAKGFERADRELVSVDFALLDSPYYEAWRRKRGLGNDSMEIILEKTGLARANDLGKLQPTRAAVLLFAEYPNDLLDTKCAIRVFQYEGNLETIRETLNLIGIPKTIGGPIIKQISDAHEYVLNLLRAGMRIPSGFVTTYRIPERAVKEAITNAVIHRDYHAKRDIEIKVFEDRIEIESPGLLPFNITPSNIGIDRAHGYRNDLIVKHLREFPEPPNLDQNEGVKAMRETMNRASLYPPIFVTYPKLQDAVRVVLFNEEAPSEWDKISHYLGKNKYISNSEARGILHIDDTSKVSRLLSRWVKQGLLTKIVPRTGAKRNIRYRLPVSDEKNLFATDKSI
jgi:ATP-dependent DNA helicase RecG